MWLPFSQKDSDAIEHAFISSKILTDIVLPTFYSIAYFFLDDSCNESIIPTDGSRFDVYLNQRIRKPVYWSDQTTSVRRCSWFLRSQSGSKFIPYEESVAILLEVIINLKNL